VVAADAACGPPPRRGAAGGAADGGDDKSARKASSSPPPPSEVRSLGGFLPRPPLRSASSKCQCASGQPVGSQTPAWPPLTGTPALSPSCVRAALHLRLEEAHVRTRRCRRQRQGPPHRDPLPARFHGGVGARGAPRPRRSARR